MTITAVALNFQIGHEVALHHGKSNTLNKYNECMNIHTKMTSINVNNYKIYVYSIITHNSHFTEIVSTYKSQSDIYCEKYQPCAHSFDYNTSQPVGLSNMVKPQKFKYFIESEIYAYHFGLV